MSNTDLQKENETGVNPGIREG